MISISSIRRLCLATCFSPSDKDSWRWLKLYQDALSEQNMELVVLSCVPSPNPELRTIILPLWMHGYAQAYGVSTESATLEESVVSTLAQRDRAWSAQENRPLTEFTDGLAVCQQVLRTLLDELQPSAVLVWSDILPQSVVLQQLAQQKGVPCWIIERGLLPETLMVEMAGQVGQSELNRSFTLSQVMKHSADISLFTAAQTDYLAKCQTKYTQAEFLGPAEFQKKFNPQKRKLVAALLQFDIASNYFPADYPAARIHQTGFESSRDAIRHLSAAAAESGCLVIVKPHPLDHEDYSALENNNLRVVRDVNLHSLIRAADVVACMASSTQFEALLYEKPVLLLARSPLANKGVAYEPQTAAELPDALQAALERRDFKQRMNAGRRFLDFLLRYFSVALTDTSHAVPKLHDLASLIARNSVSSSSTQSVNERLSSVGHWLNSWESAARKKTAIMPAAKISRPPETNGFNSVKDDLTELLWQRDESLKEAGARLAGKKSGIRVVSFDFFDTLVSRVCGEPNDLFIEVGRQLAARGLFVRPFTPMEFFSVRIAADERARKNAARRGRFVEIKLAEIYAELKNVVTDVAAACRLEFDLECNYCFLNPAVASLVQHAKALGYKVAVISDTYFSTAQLQQLLRENNFSPSLFDLFLVSCERGNAKWNGQLYQDLFRHFDIHPGELMHFGDNLHADYHASRQFGAQAVHYYKTTPQLDQLLAGEKNLRGSNQHFAGALNSVRILTARCAESNQDAFRDGAFVFGPVLARYADWCVEKFKAANVRKVLALMREGELLGELVRRSAAIAKFDLEIVTCFTSRRATARAAMLELSPDAALELLEGSSTVTLQSVLEVLGLGEEVARQFDPKSLRKPMPTQESINELLKLLFENPRIRELIEAGRKESFDLAFDYLSSLAGNESNVGVLDIGWGGSIQRNIARILRRGGCKVRTVGCYLARTRKSGRLALDGDEVHAFMEQEWSRLTILPELAITSPVSSTNGYERDVSGAVRPVLGKYELSSAEQLVKTRLRDGILEFQSFWLKLRAQKNYPPETLADMDQQTASIFYRLLEYPSKAEADRLGVLTHDENYFGENFSAPLCDDQTPRHLQRDGVQAVFQVARCYWPQGVVARNNPRLITALRSGWNDRLALGRLGAWHGTPIGEGGLTDEEASTLGMLVNALSLQQIIFVGPLVPVLVEIFQFLWRHEARPADVLKNKPKLIFVGSTDDKVANEEFLSRCAFVKGNLDDPKTVRAIRTELVSDANIALVMPGELPDAAAQGLLNGLAPFLGQEGVVLTACGRFDRSTVMETLPVAKTLDTWLKKNGRELGFTLWTGNAAARAPLYNWIVFRRALTQAVWNNQWMFTAADLALAEETENLLLAKS